MKAATCNSGGRGGTHEGHGSTRWSYGGSCGSRDGGHGRGRGGPRANVAATEETLSVTLLCRVTSTSNNFGNFANYAYMGEGT
jgi:hypothetical protein